MRCFYRAAAVFAAAGVTACGGAKAEQPPAAAPRAASPEPSPEAVALTPVAMPREVFAIARILDPARAVDTGVRWSTLPLDWRGLLAKEAPGLERVLSFDAPADFAAMLDPSSPSEPRVWWAFAVGVASVDAAAGFFREQGRTVVRDGASGYRIDDSDLKCVATPALGLAPARVVCSEDSTGLAALAPYMARGLPTQSFGPSEIHAHVVAEPFRGRYGAQIGLLRTVGVPFALRELELDSPKFDRALRDALYGVADEAIALAADVDRFDLDVTVAPDGAGLDVGTSLAFLGHKSWLSQTFARAAGHEGQAPDFFWKLPEDATSASFSVYSDPEQMRPVVESLRALADGLLDYEGLGDKRRAALTDALSGLFTLSAKSAYASLPMPPSSGHGATSSPERTRDGAISAIGEHLFVVDQGGDKFVRAFSELVRTLSDPGFRAHLKKTKVIPEAEMPTARERTVKGGAGLPSGTKAFELAIPGAAFGTDALSSTESPHGAKKAATASAPPLSVVVIAVPDAPLTWFAAGTDEKNLIERLLQAKKGGAATLANRDGLASLHAGSALSAGFTSLASVLASLLSPGIGKDLGIDDQALARLPHRGETPVVFHTTVAPVGPKVVASAHVPEGVIQDLVALGASQAARR